MTLVAAIEVAFTSLVAGFLGGWFLRRRGRSVCTHGVSMWALRCMRCEAREVEEKTS